MDAFYASVEQRDNPALKGLPVAVGGGAERGVVAAASYEARKFGVRSAMPSKTAKRLCPNLIFTKPRFEAYKSVSQQIRAIFYQFTDIVEPLSLDEAYLDVSEHKSQFTSATEIAQEIRRLIFDETQLTASAGVSYNKFLAKTASDVNKPNGIFVIKPNQAIAFVETLPIHKFFGIGKVTADKMHILGVHNGLDLRNQSLDFLNRHFGKMGSYYFNIARAEDNRAVSVDRESKSVSIENTYSKDLHAKNIILEKLYEMILPLLKRVEKQNIAGKTLSIKVKFEDFTSITRNKTGLVTFSNIDTITQAINQIMDPILPFQKGIRLLGLGISNFKEDVITEGYQYKLEFL